MSDPAGDIILRYSTSRDDQIAKLQRYAGESSAARYLPVWSYVTIVALSWLSAALFFIRQGDRNYLYLGSAALALFLTIALPALYRRYQHGFFASVLTDDNLRGLAGPVEFTVGESAIEEKGTVTTLRSSWKDIVAVERHSHRTFIFAAPMVAIVIPDSAFGSDSERDALIDLLRTRIDASRS